MEHLHLGLAELLHILKIHKECVYSKYTLFSSSFGKQIYFSFQWNCGQTFHCVLINTWGLIADQMVLTHVSSNGWFKVMKRSTTALSKPNNCLLLVSSCVTLSASGSTTSKCCQGQFTQSFQHDAMWVNVLMVFVECALKWLPACFSVSSGHGSPVFMLKHANDCFTAESTIATSTVTHIVTCQSGSVNWSLHTKVEEQCHGTVRCVCRWYQ